VIIPGMVPGKSSTEILTVGFWTCESPLMCINGNVKYAQGLKTMFLCPQGRVIHAIRRGYSTGGQSKTPSFLLY